MKKFREVECDFSFKHFKECIKNALEKKYVFLRFDEYDKAKKYDKVIFFRHDIDFDIDHALKIASIEKDFGIKSTYFIRVLGRYNPWNINVFNSIKKISGMGHEIGLHYESDFSILNNRNLAEDLNFYILMLKHFLNIEVKSIAPHEPVNTKSLVLSKEIEKKIGYVIQAYSDFFFRECKYISDSGSRWREGCMHDFINKNIKKLCILTHPIFWYERSPIENY